jgi:phage protein D
MSAFIDLEVTNRDHERDGFQMTFTLGKESPLDFSLLREGFFDPPNRVIIAVSINVVPEVLIDGIITNLQIMPSNRPGESRLTVTGEDISLKLDLEDKNRTSPNQSDSTIVQNILDTYTTLGLTSRITPTTNTPTEADHLPSWQWTDLAYIQELARRNGFVFYIEPATIGTNIAYWGPENRLDDPQPALTMNMGTATNIDTPIHFSYDALAPVEPQVGGLQRSASSSRPPLSRRPAMALRKTINRQSAKLNAGRADLQAQATISQSADAVRATGEIDATRYGRALRSRRLVGVRGVGESYSGLYYVQEVTHRIRIGEYKQSFTLKREGVGAMPPTIPI